MKKKFDYVINNFNLLYEISLNDYNISYGIDNKSKIQIKKGNVDIFSNKKNIDIKTIIWKEWKNKLIPFIFDIEENEIISIDNNNVIINFDIIAASFYFLSGWQEFIESNKDTYGRFRFIDSIQYKLDIINIPIVNYYFDILKYSIEKSYKIKIDYRNKKDNFVTFISHDIDTCESAWLQGSKSEIKNNNFITPIKLLYNKLLFTDKWFNFNEIIELEKKLKINSTFFFLCKKGKKNNIPNADYTISKKKFKKVFSYIINQGSEIGIHGSIGTYIDSEKLELELKTLKNNIKGNRFHFLYFDIVKSPIVLQKCNIKYDSSLGFAEHYGFRNSYCFPFFLYNFENDSSTNILEIPLILMDGTLQNKRYMNINQENIIPKIHLLIKEIKKFNGVFSILWHNTHFSKYKYAGWKEIFIKIIELCKQENSTFYNGIQIYNKTQNIV